MTGRPAGPTAQQARQACNRVLADAAASGRRPSVLAAAHALGLSNTTFRRRFPDLATELTTARRTPAASTGTPTPVVDERARLVARNARLRRENRRLREHLDLAVANIARLTLLEQQLRDQLEAAAQVPTLAGRGPRRR